jgi:cytochrome b
MPNPKIIQVWRWPVRLMHWCMVAAFCTAMLTRLSEFDRMIHVYAGYAMGCILVIRIVYGFVAHDLAAFRRFPPSLRKGLRYLFDLIRGEAKNYLGHNPAGGLAIYGMLGLGLLSVASGYWAFEYDNDTAKLLHHTLSYTWFGLVCVHLFGVIAGSLAHQEFLVAAMITGNKTRYAIRHPFSLEAAGMTLLILILQTINLCVRLVGGKGFLGHR